MTVWLDRPGGSVRLPAEKTILRGHHSSIAHDPEQYFRVAYYRIAKRSSGPWH